MRLGVVSVTDQPPRQMFTPVYVSIEEATKPKEGYTAMLDRWWVVHPEHGLTFAKFKSFRAPQCNHDRRLPEDLIASFYPGHEARFMPLVFVRPEPEDRW